MEKTEQSILIIFIVLLNILRLPFLFRPLYIDESYWGYNLSGLPHPFLGKFIYTAFLTLLGDSTLVYRLVPFFFSIGIMFLVYLFAKKSFNQDVALYSLAVLSISFWFHIASTQVDFDGAILTFFYILAIYYLYISLNDKPYYTILCGIAIGVSFLVKFAAMPLLASSFLLIYINSEHLSDFIKKATMLSFTSISIFIFSMFIQYLTNPNWTIFILNHSSKLTIANFSLLPFVYLIIWSTPLLYGSFILFLLYDSTAVKRIFRAFHPFKRIKKEDIPYSLVLIPPFIVLLVYLFGPANKPYDRYLMPMIPFMAISTACLFYKVRHIKGWLFKFSSLTAGFLMLMILNLSSVIIPHSLSAYYHNLLNADFNFFLPITGPSGPIYMASMAGILLMGLIIFLVVFLSLTKRLRQTLIVFSLFISMGANLFLIVDSTYKITQPDYDRTYTEMMVYVDLNNLRPIISNTLSSNYYLKRLNPVIEFEWNEAESNEYRDKRATELINTFDGYFAFFDFPKYSPENPIFQFIDHCKKIKSFTSAAVETASVYRCSPKTS